MAHDERLAGQRVGSERGEAACAKIAVTTQVARSTARHQGALSWPVRALRATDEGARARRRPSSARQAHRRIDAGASRYTATAQTAAPAQSSLYARRRVVPRAGR